MHIHQMHLEYVFHDLKEQFPNKKIILLFGCGGNRDQNKRSKMEKLQTLFR